MAYRLRKYKIDLVSGYDILDLENGWKGRMRVTKKRIPYGISNFAMLRERNYLYVDKTMFVEVLERYPPYQLFLRPRRFGKSLLLSMLENYYDRNKKNEFDALFGDLYIGRNPTPERHKYLVLHLSFAGIVSSEGKERLIQSFDDNVISGVRSLIRMNRDIFEEDNLPENVIGAEMAIRYLVNRVRETGQSLFVLIDEYDNFTNDLAGIGKRDLYEELITGEGYVRAFYKTLKDGTTKSVARVLLTGVSPVMLDDLTSGFNITTDLSQEVGFNGLAGFTEEEIRGLIGELELARDFNVEDVIRDMREFYNGYRFSDEAGEKIYNPDMVLYFLAALEQHKRYPKQILDYNVRTDYRKLRELSCNFRDEDTMETILQNETVTVGLVERFQLAEMFSRKENFISLLYYFGMLTIKGSKAGRLVLGIPNYVARMVFWEYFSSKLERNVNLKNEQLLECIQKMRIEGEISGFISYLQELLGNLSYRDMMKFDEKYLKVIIMTLFSIDGVYLVQSEYETEKGYVDLFLVRDARYEESTRYEWLLELKVLKAKDRKRLDEVKMEGLEQLARYGVSDRVKYGFKGEKVKKALLIMVGKDEVVCFRSKTYIS